MGKTGSDASGKMIREGLAAEGINIDSLGTSAQPSGTAWVMLDSAAENAIVVLPGANADLLPADVAAAQDLVAQAKVVFDQELPSDLDGFKDTVEASRAHDKLVVATLGSRGAFAWANGKAIHIPAPKVNAVDTTGAGDTFIGALADAISRGEDLFASVKWAVRASAFAVGHLGATTGMPTRDQVVQAQF